LNAPLRQLGLALAGAALALPLAAQSTGARRGFSITITEPRNQSIVVGKTRIAAEIKVESMALVDRVEFVVGDKVIFVDREPPWECLHDFGEESKSWVIRAVAYHREDVSVSDAVITRRVPFTVVERVNRVLLWVSAKASKGGFVTDLGRDDFRVFEEGREQKILEFGREERPITLAIILDSSGSMRDKLSEVHAAASAFVDTLREADRALVIDFDDKVFLLEDLTSDRERLKRAIESTEAIGGTALYDVMHVTYRKIGKIEGRRAIVLLSDGEDTASHFKHDRVIEEAKSNNTLIYAIGLVGGGAGVRRNLLQEFAEVTGGRVFFVKQADELGEVYQRIAEELRSQYYITYSTTNETWDGRWVDLRVETTREDLKLRTRSGYFAVRAGEPGAVPGDEP
jgi:VWFA-related protein